MTAIPRDTLRTLLGWGAGPGYQMEYDGARWKAVPSTSTPVTLTPVSLNWLKLLSYTVTGGAEDGAWTDGNTTTTNYGDAGTGTQERTFDLGGSLAISTVRWWLYYGDARIYANVALYGSNDGSTWDTLRAPSSYDPDSSGLTITVNASYRYIKFHGEGSDMYPNNEWVELRINGVLNVTT